MTETSGNRDYFSLIVICSFTVVLSRSEFYCSFK